MLPNRNGMVAHPLTRQHSIEHNQKTHLGMLPDSNTVFIPGNSVAQPGVAVWGNERDAGGNKRY
jgi:hypothetical protein